MAKTIHFTFEDLQLSVKPTAFETVNSVKEPSAGTFKVEDVGGIGLFSHDLLGTSGSFTVVNQHDVKVNVTDVFGAKTNLTFDLHGSLAREFIHRLDTAYHHQG